MKLRLISNKEAKKRRKKRRLKKFLIFTCTILLLFLGIFIFNRCNGEVNRPHLSAHKLSLNASSTYNSVNIEITNTTYESYLNNITAIEFGKGNALISYDVTTREFLNLDSNTSYTVKVYYTVTLNNGKTESKVLTRNIATKAKNAPTVTLMLGSFTLSDTSISTELNITDKSSTLISYSTELYLGHELIARSEEKNPAFFDLSPATTYVLRVKAKYDLSDGKGAVEKTMVEKVVKMPPRVTVSDVQLLTDEHVMEGESVFIKLTFDNPDGVKIYGATINNAEYGAIEQYGTDSICLELPNEGAKLLGEGNVELKIMELIAMHESLQYRQKLYGLSVFVTIRSDVKIKELELVNADLTPVNHVTPGEEVYALVTLKNQTEAVVTGATVSNESEKVTNVVKIDDERWLIPISTDSEPGWHSVSLESITVSDKFASKTIEIENGELLYATIDHDNVRYVSTAEDLKNMNEGYYYELTGDIDLSGVSWSGAEFNGFFNGCGYSIKNVSCATNVTNQNAYAGLFSVARGTIANLVIENSTLLVKINVQESGEFVGYCGGIAAYARELMIVNCRVDGSCTFSISATAGTPVYCGGLVGAGSATIANSHSAARLSSSVYCGGLIGASEDSQTKIKDSSNSGNVSVTGAGNDFFVGGLMGYGTFDISNSYNSGNVTGSTFASVNGTACVGGLVGAGYGNASNSYNAGNVTSDLRDAAHTGGLFGRLTQASEIKHSYNVGTVSAKSTFNVGHTGGLIGLIDNGASITESYFSGEVSCQTTNATNVHVGGLVGVATSGTVDISNCYAEGTIYISAPRNGHAGGMLSHAVDVKLTVSNCYVNCSMNMKNGTYLSAGGVLSNNSGNITINNVFSDCTAFLNGRRSTLFNGIANGTTKDIEVSNSFFIDETDRLVRYGESLVNYDVYSLRFYTEILGWSEDIWDFSALYGNYGNQIRYPMLK